MKRPVEIYDPKNTGKFKNNYILKVTCLKENDKLIGVAMYGAPAVVNEFLIQLSYENFNKFDNDIFLDIIVSVDEVI